MHSTQLVGRANELATLNGFLQRAHRGQGGIVLLTGEAGMGKTRLAQETLEQSGHLVLTGRARLGVAAPYAPVAAALRQGLRRTDSKQKKTGALSPYLAMLLPELGPGARQSDPHLLVEAIIDALTATAKDRTTVLFLDDLQWADNATLELLPLLAERIGGERMMVVGTYRSDEVQRGHPIRRLRDELRRSGLLQEIVVAPLDADQTATLLQQRLGGAVSPALEKLVFEQTQGLPLYVEELARALSSSGHLQRDERGAYAVRDEEVPIPESVRDSVLLRLDALSDAARENLQVAALMGLEFDFEWIEELAGGSSDLEALVQANFVFESKPGKGTFHHALIREVIRNEIAWSKRRALSRRIATYLERQGVPPEQVAQHWLEAREYVAACRALMALADRSCHLHAYRDAALAANRALEIWPEQLDESKRLEALQRLAHCAQVSGQLSDALRALQEIADSPLVRRDPVRHAEVMRSLATVYRLQGANERALAAHETSAHAFAEAKELAEAAQEWLAVAGRHAAMSHLERALNCIRTARDLAKQVDRIDLLVRTQGFEGNVLAMLGEHEAGKDLAQQALSLALEAKHNEAASEAYRRLASVLDYASDFAGARDAYATALDYCRMQGDENNTNACLGCMSAIVFRTGEWKKALEIEQEISGERTPDRGALAITKTIAGLIQTIRGEARAARKTLQASYDLSMQNDVVVLQLMCQFGFGLMAEMGRVPDLVDFHLT